MIYGTFRRSVIALGATALASLIPLSSATAAQAERQEKSGAARQTSAAGHQTSGAARQTMNRSAVHSNTTMRTSSRTSVSRTSERSSRTVVGGRYGYTRGYGSTVGVAVGGTYGVAYSGYGRSCWWYRHYAPGSLPASCGAYYSGPTYSYSYGYSHPTYGRYAYGVSHVNRGVAVRTSTRQTTRQVEGRAASTSVENTHKQGGAHPMSSGATHSGAQPKHTGERPTH
jgi:hypothetical protein